ncbi:nucleotide-diphospho-sugar transferase family protein, partial [Striga asiatica]
MEKPFLGCWLSQSIREFMYRYVQIIELENRLTGTSLSFADVEILWVRGSGMRSIKTNAYLALIRIRMALRKNDSHIIIQVKTALTFAIDAVIGRQRGRARFALKARSRAPFAVGANKTEQHTDLPSFKLNVISFIPLICLQLSSNKLFALAPHASEHKVSCGVESVDSFLAQEFLCSPLSMARVALWRRK